MITRKLRTWNQVIIDCLIYLVNSEVNKLLESAKKEEKKAKKRDYYKILDLTPQATESDIRKAYKKLALKFHPDRVNGGEEDKKQAEKMFRDINDAYSVLSDPKKKQMYDSGMDPLDPESGSGGFGEGGFSGGSMNPNDIFRVFFGGGGNQGAGGPESKNLFIFSVL